MRTGRDHFLDRLGDGMIEPENVLGIIALFGVDKNGLAGAVFRFGGNNQIGDLALLIEIPGEPDEMAADQNEIGSRTFAVHVVGEKFFPGELVDLQPYPVLEADFLKNFAVQAAMQHI